MEAVSADLLFPPRLARSLLDSRGPAWESLVRRVLGCASGSREVLAFVLMVARLSGCPNCNSDSHRAAQGCAACAALAVKRFHGTDRELVRLYESAQAEVNNCYPARSAGAPAQSSSRTL